MRITFPVLNAVGTVIGDGGTAFYPAGQDSKYQFFPPHTAVKVQVDVQNTTDQAVLWSYGTAYDGMSGGVFNADGTWMTPFSPSSDPSAPFVLVATSHADPNQFAKGAVLIVNIDADADTELDALDLGQIAACYGLTYQENPFPTTKLLDGDATGDWDVAMFNQVLAAAWPVK